MGNALLELLEQCTVRIEGPMQGTGFFVTPDLVLTCAHVLGPDPISGRRGVHVLWNGLEDPDGEIVGVLPGDDDDLALLRVTASRFPDHPVATLGTEMAIGDALWSFGYPVYIESRGPQGDGLMGSFESRTYLRDDGRRYLIKFRDSRVVPGFSGAPLLDRVSGRVIGIVIETLDARLPVGGWAVPVEFALEAFPQLASATLDSAARSSRWARALREEREAQLWPSLALPYQQKIAEFREMYLGSPEEPEPFGGRDDDLRLLSAWLDEPGADPRLLLTAPAGRGKSALIVRWLEQLGARPEEGGTLHIVFAPVSARLAFNSQTAVFEALASRLARVYGDPPPGSSSVSSGALADLCGQYLSRSLPPGERLLVAIDGLDEAAAWEECLPFSRAPLADRVRLLVSARWTYERPSPEGWAAALGWNSGRPARRMELSPLTNEGLRDVMLRLGAPREILLSRPHVVQRLHELSDDGDPLLLSLYAKDLWSQMKTNRRFMLEDIDGLKPGLAAYFDRWWEDQERLWGTRFGSRAKLTRELFHCLSCAHGPLESGDLRRLVASDFSVDIDELDAALYDLRRFVLFDPTGRTYALAHARFAIYRQDALRNEGRLEHYERRYLDWGRESVEESERRLAQKEPFPPAGPVDRTRRLAPYIVRNYGAHLDRANAGVAEFMALLDGGWRLARYALEVTDDGFLSDIDRVAQAARRENDAAAARGEWPAFLGAEITAELCHASAEDKAGQLPLPVVEALLKTGKWSVPVALACERRRKDPKSRCQSMLAIAAFAPESRREEILSIALEATRAMKDEGRATWLAAVAECSQGALRARIWRDAVAAVKEADDDESRSNFICALAERAPDNVLASLLPIAKRIRDPKMRRSALASIAGRMDPRKAAVIWKSVLKGAIGEWERDSYSSKTLDIAVRAPEPFRTKALSEALRAACKQNSSLWAEHMCESVAERLTPALVPRALEDFEHLTDNVIRARSLAALATRAEGAERDRIFTLSLNAALAISDEYRRRHVVIRQIELADKAFLPRMHEAVASFHDVEEHTHVFVCLTCRFGPEQGTHPFETAIELVGKLTKDYEKPPLLSQIASSSPEVLVPALLDAAADFDDEGQRDVLEAIANRRPVPNVDELLRGAMNVHDYEPRAHALSALSPGLSKEQLETILPYLSNVGDGLARATLIRTLLPSLSESSGVYWWKTALEAAFEVLPHDSMRHIADVAPLLAPPLRMQVEAAALDSAIALTWYKQYLPALSEVSTDPDMTYWKTVVDELLSSGKSDETVALAVCDLAPELSQDAALAVLVRIFRILDRLVSQAAEGAVQCVMDSNALALVLQAARILSGRIGVAHVPEYKPTPRSNPQIWSDAIRASESLLVNVRAKVLVSLSRMAPGCEIEAALRQTLTLVVQEKDALSLSTLAPIVPGDLVEDALSSAEAMVMSWNDDGVTAVACLASRLDTDRAAEVLDRGLDRLQQVSETDRCRRVAKLIPYLPLSLLRQEIESARHVADPELASQILTLAVDRLPAEERQALVFEAAEIARKIDDPVSQGDALGDLARRAGEPGRQSLWRETLTAFVKEPSPGRRRWALDGILNTVPLDLLVERNEELSDVGNSLEQSEGLWLRLSIWRTLWSRQPQLPQALLAWRRAIRAGSAVSRARLLDTLGMVPIRDVGRGHDATLYAEAIAEALQRVVSWWP